MIHSKSHYILCVPSYPLWLRSDIRNFSEDSRAFRAIEWPKEHSLAIDSMSGRQTAQMPWLLLPDWCTPKSSECLSLSSRLPASLLKHFHQREVHRFHRRRQPTHDIFLLSKTKRSTAWAMEAAVSAVAVCDHICFRSFLPQRREKASAYWLPNSSRPRNGLWRLAQFKIGRAKRHLQALVEVFFPRAQQLRRDHTTC